MFKSMESLLFVEVIHKRGEYEGNKYDYHKIKLSDGFESMELTLKSDDNENIIETFNRGDRVHVVIDVNVVRGKVYFYVKDVLPLTTSKAS